MATNSRPPCIRNLAHEIIYVVMISCTQLLTQAALGNVLVPLTIIGSSLHINVAQLPWTLAAYSLTVGVFIMITGRLGDIFGHKLLLILGFIIFGIFSGLTGIAVFVKNGIYFDVMRALQGLGPAMILPNGVALLARTYPIGPRKSLVFSIFGASAPTGFILGALVGSLLAEYVWWPWGQWALGIFCMILAILCYWFVPAELASSVEPSGKVDIIGALLGLLGLVLFIYCWNEGPIIGWDKSYVYGVLIASMLIIVLFIFVETKVKEPIMPPSIWLVNGFPGVLASIALGWSSFGIFIFYIVQFLQKIRNVSPLLTTAMLSPLVLFGLVATASVSKLYGRVPPHYLLMVAMICFCVGNSLIATVPPDQTYWLQIFLSTVITPFGMDISFPAASLIVSNTVPTQQQGVAASMINTVINWSISLGLGIAGTIESQMIKMGKTTLEGYRSALYAGIGLSGISIIVVLLFCRVKQQSCPADKIVETSNDCINEEYTGSRIHSETSGLIESAV